MLGAQSALVLAFTPDVYDEAIRQLEQAGAGFGKVPGRTFQHLPPVLVARWSGTAAMSEADE